MKILSKYKDYYDYLTGIYGEDPKIILDRREASSITSFNGDTIDLYICDYLLQGLYWNNRYYWGHQLLEFAEEDSKQEFLKGKRDTIYIDKKYRGDRGYSTKISINPVYSHDLINRKNNCAILVKQFMDKIDKYPRLELLNIGSIISPHNMYMMLSEWLAPKENFTDTRTDREKIQSAGFDLKHSFRNTK